MPPKKAAVNVVELDSSSDDELSVGVVASSAKTALSVSAPEGPWVGSNPRLDNHTLQSRTFWKAGDYVVASTANSTSTEDALEHSRVHPKFLHSNATSHKWAFGGANVSTDQREHELITLLRLSVAISGQCCG